MRAVAAFLFVISLAVTTAAAQVDRHTFKAPPDKVYDAAIKAARAMPGTITAQDRARGVLDCRVEYSTGKFSSQETPHGYNLHVTVQPESGGKTLMLVEAHEIGFNQASGPCGNCTHLAVGKTFLKRVGRALKGKSPQGRIMLGGGIPLPGR